MKNVFIRSCLFIAMAVMVAACNSQTPSDEGLKDALDGKFYMGAALNSQIILGKDTSSVLILEQHFNSITAENVMKSGRIQPIEGEFAFDLPDIFVEYGLQNDLYIVGHCLVWHSQAPRWFFVDKEGNDVSREVLIDRMETHISSVVGRYKGKVHCWDVVNEAFEDNGDWRNTKFYQIIGEEFIELAFKFANQADPDAELIYNDYSMHHKGRRDAVVQMVKELQAKGIRIDGIGMQAHYGMGHPGFDEFEESLLAFSRVGMDVHITELDVTVLDSPDPGVGAEVSASFEYQEKMNPYKNGLPEKESIALNDRYLDFFNLFLKHQDKIKRVTTWGISDNDSWKNDWPIRGRTNYPLLFDREYEAKPVVSEIIKADKQ